MGLWEGIAQSAVGTMNAGVNLFGTLWNSSQQQKLMDKQIQAQKDLQASQNQFNLDMWNLNNQYNSPEAQAQRFRDAGLNVGMAMSGQGAVASQPVTASQAQIPTAPTPAGDMTSVGAGLANGVNALLELRKQDIDRKIREREVSAKEKEVDSNVSLNNVLEGYHEAKTDESRQQAKTLQATAAATWKSIDETQKKMDLIDQQIKSEIEGQLFTKAKTWREYQSGKADMMNAVTNKMNAETNRITANATTEYMKKQGEMIDSNIEINKANVYKIGQDIVESRSRTKLNNVDFKWKDKNYKIDYEMKQGQVKIMKINGEVAELTKYADVINGYVGCVDNIANCVSDVAGAALDVSTFGATSKFRKGRVENQRAQTYMWDQFGTQAGGVKTTPAGYSYESTPTFNSAKNAELYQQRFGAGSVTYKDNDGGFHLKL